MLFPEPLFNVFRAELRFSIPTKLQPDVCHSAGAGINTSKSNELCVQGSQEYQKQLDLSNSDPHLSA